MRLLRSSGFVLAYLLFTLGLYSSSVFGQKTPEAGFLSSVPRNLAQLRSMSTSNTSNIFMARNETEMVFLRLSNGRNAAWNLDVQGIGNAGLTAEFFEVLPVPVQRPGVADGEELIFDPILPLANGHLAAGNEKPRFLLVKIWASPSAKAGQHQLKVIVGPEGRGKRELELSVAVKLISLPDTMPVKIQAAIWPPSKKYASLYRPLNNRKATEAMIVELMKFLRAYRINSLSRLWQPKPKADMTWHEEDIAVYTRLVTIALEELGYQLIRLPNPVFFRGRKPFNKVYGFDSAGITRWISDIKTFLKQFDHLLNNPKWEGRFAFEIWDEPWKKQMPEVNMLYKAFRANFPDIILELTREPYAEGELADVADIWAISLLRFDDRFTQSIKRKGDEVWLYANRWQGIDRAVTDARAIGWAISQFDLDGYLLWGVNRWSADPWTAVSNKQTDFFKRATFVYPHPATGRVVPSLRLEFLREGLEDMLLLHAVQERLPTSLATQIRHIFPRPKPKQITNLPNFGRFHDLILAEM